MNQNQDVSTKLLAIDLEQETEKICSRIRDLLKNRLKRRGMVVGVSGGIDSSVTAALAARALGKERVFALEKPERHSAEETVSLSTTLIEHFGVDSLRVDLSPILEALGCYRSYDDALRLVIAAH